MALALIPPGRSDTLSSFQSNVFPERIKMSWFRERFGGEKRKYTGENGKSYYSQRLSYTIETQIKGKGGSKFNPLPWRLTDVRPIVLVQPTPLCSFSFLHNFELFLQSCLAVSTPTLGDPAPPAIQLCTKASNLDMEKAAIRDSDIKRCNFCCLFLDCCHLSLLFSSPISCSRKSHLMKALYLLLDCHQDICPSSFQSLKCSCKGQGSWQCCI